MAKVKGNLQSKGIGVGIVAASAVVLLVAAVVVLLWFLSRGSGSTTQVGIVVFEVSVPQEIPLTEYSGGLMDNGTTLDLSGNTASLRFQGDYLEAVDLPVSYSSGQLLASFSDSGAGIYLEQDGTGQPTLRFPLFTSQGGMPLTITGTVETIQPQAQGSQMRISLGRMEAEAEFSVVQGSDSRLPFIGKVRLAFELHRLPKDARLTVSRLQEMDRSTRSTIDSALDESRRWTIALALEVRRTNLDNGDDVGEAALYLTLPDLGLGSMESMVAVHVDDEGHAERLESEIVSSLDGGSMIQFLSPRGLSIFAVMVPYDASVVTPTPIPTPTASAIATPSVSPSPTPIPTSAATLTPVPTSTPSPMPTSTVTSTPIPIPVADERYAVIVHTHDLARQQWLLDTLGTRWFLDWTDNTAAIPDGHEKLIAILDLPGPTAERVQEIAKQAPGSVWYVVGEPNRRIGDGYGASDIVTQLHDLYVEIKAADPTARITSPSILNWEFTCNGCGGGFQTGHSWVDEFRTAYMGQYEEEPPVDIWAIDVYPLDWLNRPTVDHQLVIDQIDGLRQYLDANPAQQDKPIWITELGLHWGWDDWEWFVDGCTIDGVSLPSPAGTYQTEQVIGYLGTVFDWLEANAASKNIEKWFLLGTYANITTCNFSAYAGLTLFDGLDAEASLTPVGQYFVDRVLGIR